MEVRKLQRLGRTYSVSLPPDWIKENKLKPSDQITFTREEDRSLRLVPGIILEEKEELKTTIDVDRYKDHGLLARLISASYVRGCDIIEIVSKHTISEDHRKEIQGAIGNLLGLGIVESNSKCVMLQSVVDSAKFPIRPLLKRLCGLVSSMFEDAMQALKDKDSSLATGVIQRENWINKIYTLLRRQIAVSSFDKTILKKIELRGMPEMTLYTLIGPKIRSITENVLDIANNQLAIGQKEIGDSDLQKIIRLGKIAHEIFSNAVEAFFNEDLVLANRTAESISTFDEATEELMNKLSARIKDTDLGKHLNYIIRDLRRITGHAKLIAGTAIIGSVFHKI
jgi:phosphate transport system protein